MVGDAEGGRALALVQLADVTLPVGKRDPQKEPKADFRYIDISAIDQATKEIATPVSLRGSDAPSRARQVLQSGDVLVSTVRPNLNAVAFVDERYDSCVGSTGFSVLRPDTSRLDGRFLFHWVRTPQFVDDMIRQATGASYPAVSDRIVKGSTLPLPSIEEQRRIAAVLDAADALRVKRRKALAKLDTLTQAIFIHMFGDPRSGRFDLRRMGDLALKFSDGPFGSNLKSSHYVESGVRVIRLQNIGVGRFDDDDRAYITERHFEALAKHECLPGDVLVGTLGDPNLRACAQPGWLPRAINKADCVQIRVNPNLAETEWLVALLNCAGTEKLAHALVKGQTRARISMGRLRELEVPVPPLALQQEFAGVAQEVRQREVLAGRSMAALGQLFSSLQQRAFRGEL